MSRILICDGYNRHVTGILFNIVWNEWPKSIVMQDWSRVTDYRVPEDAHYSSLSASSSRNRSGIREFNGGDEFEQTLLHRSAKRLRTDYDRYSVTPNDIWARALPWWRVHHDAFQDLGFWHETTLLFRHQSV